MEPVAIRTGLVFEAGDRKLGVIACLSRDGQYPSIEATFFAEFYLADQIVCPRCKTSHRMVDLAQAIENGDVEFGFDSDSGSLSIDLRALVAESLRSTVAA